MASQSSPYLFELLQDFIRVYDLGQVRILNLLHSLEVFAKVAPQIGINRSVIDGNKRFDKTGAPQSKCHGNLRTPASLSANTSLRLIGCLLLTLSVRLRWAGQAYAPQ